MNVTELHSVSAPTIRKSTNTLTQKRQNSLSGELLEGIRMSPSVLGSRTFEQSSMSKINALLAEAAEYLGVTDLSTLDTSPEATAGRIADFAISMFSIYKRQNPDMEDGEQLDKFENLIRGAIDKGFNEAMSILSSVNALNPEVQDNANKTYELIQEKLDNWFSQARSSLFEQSEE